jgi:hypothetical protein
MINHCIVHILYSVKRNAKGTRNPKKIAMQSYQFSLGNLVHFVLKKGKQGITYCQYVNDRSPNSGVPFCLQT